MKDLFIGLLLGIVIGVLGALVFTDVFAYAETSKVITVSIQDSISISEGVKP